MRVLSGQQMEVAAVSVPQHKAELAFHLSDSDEQAFDQVCKVLQQGKPAIFPTDTIFGLGIAANATESPDILYRLKERDRSKPIAWLVSSPEDLKTYGADVPAYAFSLAEAYWPGPLTLVVKASSRVPQAFQSQEGTLGLRMPASPITQGIMAVVGSPLVTTSANRSGHKTPRNFDDLEPELLKQVSGIIVSKGDLSGIASTVVDCTGERPVLLRVGAISDEDINACV